MRLNWKAIPIGCILVLLPARVLCQGLTSRAASSDDVASLDAIVAAFYDVISHDADESIDWARDSTLYTADLRFKIVGANAAGGTLQLVDHANYAAQNRDISRGFFEREIHRVTQRFGPIAQVFSTYEWRITRDGPIAGRGINAIELYFDGARWWITSAMWTAESPGNPIPREYLTR